MGRWLNLSTPRKSRVRAILKSLLKSLWIHGILLTMSRDCYRIAPSDTDASKKCQICLPSLYTNTSLSQTVYGSMLSWNWFRTRSVLHPRWCPSTPRPRISGISFSNIEGLKELKINHRQLRSGTAFENMGPYRLGVLQSPLGFHGSVVVGPSQPVVRLACTRL